MTAKSMMDYIQTEPVSADSFVNLHIVNNTVIGYYKSRIIKYVDINGNKLSYFFPVSFVFKNNVIETTMSFGFVSNDFVIPKINGTSEFTSLTVTKSDSNIPNILSAKQSGISNWGHINVKSFLCIIEALNYIGFPFFKIVTNYSLSKKLSP